ncbi:unnamed protein product [Polarella glacialis]|uniref:Uncharacterized protein n=1 Tax=Polarella glacialis TaxID=89957 RepID=A0A813HTQ3_POLGL|nr:unnamed protein product [Polarella glacialis]
MAPQQPTKHYALGRHSWELGYVMPDSKTVYGTDDGANVFFSKFVAKVAGDLSAGAIYCAKFAQTSAAGSEASAFASILTWVKMEELTDAEVKAQVKVLEFQDILETADPFNLACPSGFTSVNAGGNGLERLKVKTGQEKWAAAFEKRRYAGMLGCATEFRRWEGVAFDPKSMTAFAAISEVTYGMEDNMKKGNASTSYDAGSSNDIKVKFNTCGCVMKLSVGTDYSIAGMSALACGTIGSYSGGTDTCDPTGVASPDNVAFIPDFDQLVIGEDTSQHQNDVLWIYDMASQTMTRIASTPHGSETTSPYWRKNIGGFSYLSFIVQHPCGTSDEHMATAAGSSGTDGWVGYVGPFKAEVAATAIKATSEMAATTTKAKSEVAAASISAISTTKAGPQGGNSSSTSNMQASFLALAVLFSAVAFSSV